MRVQGVFFDGAGFLPGGGFRGGWAALVVIGACRALHGLARGHGELKREGKI